MAIVANEKTHKQSVVTPQGGQQRIGIIYARVSTKEQADNGFSLDTQVDADLQYAATNGIHVPADYIFKEDYTGTTLNRPLFTKVRALLQQPEVTDLIVYDQDRLVRKLALQLFMEEELQQAGVQLNAVTMPPGDTSPESQLLTHVRGVIAEYERAKILERTRRGRRGRAQAGHATYGGRTLGYVYVKHADKGAHYEVHPEEAPLVRRIFRLCVEDGLSSYAIAALLTREGVPTSTARRRTLPALVWHPSTVASILHNTAYIGMLYDGKTQRLPGKRNPDKKTRVLRMPRETWILIAVPSIIDPKIFEGAQVQLSRNQRLARRNRKYEYLLVGGRLRCGQCGSTLSGGNKQGIPYYLCGRKHFQDAAAAHTRRSIQARKIEPLVWMAVERALDNPHLIAEELERRREGTSAQQAELNYERQQYTRQITQCDKDLKRWEAAYLGEAIDLNDFRAKKVEVDVRRASAEQELKRLDDQQRLIEQGELETAALMEYCTRLRAGLQHSTLEEKRQVLEALDITVTWHPAWAKPKIEGNLPPELFAIVTNAAYCHSRNIAFRLTA